VGRQSRDARQRQALPGLSRAPWASLLPGCRDLAQATQPPASAGGGEAGTCRRNPGGGATGPRPTRTAQRRCGLASSQTEPPGAGLGTPCERGRSQAQANLHPLSPLLDEPRGECARRPSHEGGTPDAGQAALPGRAHGRSDAPARAERRAPADATPREPSSGPQTASAHAPGARPPSAGLPRARAAGSGPPARGQPAPTRVCTCVRRVCRSRGARRWRGAWEAGGLPACAAGPPGQEAASEDQAPHPALARCAKDRPARLAARPSLA